jgi:large subunit ribosomal protein L22
MYICSYIKGKKIDSAIVDLEDVQGFKKAVPFKGEIPHRKGKGMMSGRYPIKAAALFVNILKSLKGNSIVNGLELENTVISSASSNWSSRPARRGNRQGKRTNVILEAREIGGKK